MDLYRVNLNLLVALEALLEEQSVSKAAKKLFITQSAMSNNLLQLRDIFKNELLVREKNQMVLTGFAKELQPRLNQVLLDLNNLLKANVFDPKTSTRTFIIGMSGDGLTALILPLLLSILKKEAPHIQIDIRLITIGQLTGDEPFDHDVIIDAIFSIPLAPFIHKKLLFTDTSVCIVSRHHPLANHKTITQKAYMYANHLAILPPNPKSNASYLLDNILKKYNFRRKVQVITPHLLGYFNVIKNSDTLIGTIVKHTFFSFNSADIVMKDFPFDIPEIEFDMIWHNRYDNDIANQWLRNKLIEIGKDIQKKLKKNAL